MAYIQTEKFGHLEFDRPARGFVFDLSGRKFAKLKDIFSAKELISYINKLGIEAPNWYDSWYLSLDWKPESSIIPTPA